MKAPGYNPVNLSSEKLVSKFAFNAPCTATPLYCEAEYAKRLEAERDAMRREIEGAQCRVMAVTVGGWTSGFWFFSYSSMKEHGFNPDP